MKKKKPPEVGDFQAAGKSRIKKKGGDMKKLENAKIAYTCEPREAPAGLLSYILFGKSAAEIAAEIGTNRNGKWNEVYAE